MASLLQAFTIPISTGMDPLEQAANTSSVTQHLQSTRHRLEIDLNFRHGSQMGTVRAMRILQTLYEIILRHPETESSPFPGINHVSAGFHIELYPVHVRSGLTTLVAVLTNREAATILLAAHDKLSDLFFDQRLTEVGPMQFSVFDVLPQQKVSIGRGFIRAIS